MKRRLGGVLFVLVVFFTSCIPKEQIVLLDIRNLSFETGLGSEPVLSGDAVFFNPNASRIKLKEIKVDIFVDGKKAAVVDQRLNAIARAKSEFTVPVKVQLQLKDIGLMDALKSIFGGKRYEVRYQGKLKVNVNGLPMHIPIDHTEELKLKF